ncbi:ATP-binding protein [Desulfobacterales bacterium HSG16]|nr:ATP-binding protein [Desulfobacterales bacterium HSG16]
MKTENEYLDKAFSAFPKKIIVVSPDFTVLTARGISIGNKNLDIVGKRCYEVFFGLTEPCKNCPTRQVLETGKPALRHGDYASRSSQDLPCLFSYPIFSGNEIEALAIMDYDLLDLDILEGRLHRTNEFLRNLILSSVDAVIASDMKGNIIVFNDAAAQITGYTVDETIGKIDIRTLYSRDGANEVMTRLRSDEYGGKGKLKSCQIEILNNNGESIPIKLHAAIVYEDEKEAATVGFFHDMREDIRIKKELENAQMQLLQSEKMASLGKLAAGVAHQLNNPLGGITLFTNLILEDYELEPDVRDDLNRILKDAQRCRDTVKELLEFSRQTHHLMQPQNINTALSRTLFLLQNQTLFHNIEITRNLSPTLPPANADIQQINHMFMNIILNAAQAMKGKGRLTVNTWLSQRENLSQSEKRVVVEISDTGPGIPDDILKNIFEPFFTTKEQGEGTGLGLSMVYGIVENHGGSVKAENLPERGVKFTIELPLADDKDGGDESGKQA